MYQSIDDDIDELAAERSRFFGVGVPVLLALFAAAIVFAVVYVTSPGTPSERGDPLQPEPQARAAYLRAIGETDAPLRRARLRDFVNTHPENPRAPTAQAQLYVLDAEESRVWQQTVRAAYDGTRDQAQRAQAVEAYAAGWGRFLGGREAEIAELRAHIEGTPNPEPKPDRSLPDRPSPFSDQVPADRLEGGPIISVGRLPSGSVGQPIAPSTPAQSRIAEIVPPRVRRNRTPRYPRRAQSRGIEGVVTLSLNIDARGRVAMTELVSVEAERYAEEFVRAAERAALRTRFHPKTVDGVPTEAVGVQKRYRFESARRR